MIIRVISKQVLDRLGATGFVDTNFFPVVSSMEHNGEEVRASVVCNDSGALALVDMPFAVFNALPQFEWEPGKLTAI